jgi:hypothetical protein
MRLGVIAALGILCSVLPASANPGTTTTKTVWNIQVGSRDGGKTKMTFLDGNPNVILSSCRCVAGMWQRKGESTTHFTGSVNALSFNHPRKAVKALSVKVRKTRPLMGVQQDYRAALIGIMRGSGQLVLREVAGGEWEVVGFAPEPVGDLFAAHAKWNVDPKQPPEPAKASPVIDPKTDATALAKLINDYRASINLPRVAISAGLTKVAQAHVRDLNVNKPVKEGCNMHSWSAKGGGTACCYDSSKEAARCMWNKPKEIAGYKAYGYEIAAGASGVTPEQALALWQNSEAHHAVMINKGIWKKPWRALGVAIEGDFAVAWFAEDDK